MNQPEQHHLSLHAIVHGRVQGVNFRGYTNQQAISLGVTGWIRNLSDGTVETVAEGPESALNAYLEWLRTGPPASLVEGVDATWDNASGQFQDFKVRYF